MSPNSSSGRSLVHSHVRAPTPQQRPPCPVSTSGSRLLSLHSWNSCGQLSGGRGVGVRGAQTVHSCAHHRRVHAPGFVNLHVASSNVANYEALRKSVTTRGSPTPENENCEAPCLPAPLSLNSPDRKALAEMSDLCHPAVESPYLQGDSRPATHTHLEIKIL